MNDKTHRHFMEVAARLAHRKMLRGDGGPFGAVIVREGKILARGWNRVTSRNDPTAHAEMVAIRRACRALKSFELRGGWLYTSCEPCPMCLAAAYWARLEGIFYANTREEAAAIGFDDAFLYREVALPPEQRTLPIVRLTTPRSEQPFRAWIEKTDRIAY